MSLFTSEPPLLIYSCAKETLDAFADGLLRIAAEVDETPDVVKNSPLTMPVGRLDEVKAAKEQILTWGE